MINQMLSRCFAQGAGGRDRYLRFKCRLSEESSPLVILIFILLSDDVLLLAMS